MTPMKKIHKGDRIRVKGKTVTVTAARKGWLRAGHEVEIEYEGGSFSGMLRGPFDRDIKKAGTQ